MMNQVMLVGRIAKITDDGIEVSVPRSFKNEEGIYETDIVPVTTTDSISKNVKEYCKVGDTIGVRGRIEMKDNNIVIITEKLTFLSSKQII